MVVTIKDLAKSLNVSASTISMALNDNPRVSEKTKKAVHDLAKKMHYHPNLIARAMVKKRTSLIGLIISDIMSSFFPQIIQGIEDLLTAQAYSIIVCSTNNDAGRERDYLRMLREKRVDGIIADTVESDENKDLWEDIVARKVPAVTILSIPPIKGLCNIKVDNIMGGFLATEHLIKTGHQIIGHLAGPERFQISRDRLKGYKMALKKYNMPSSENIILETTFDWEAGYNNMRLLLQTKPRPTAVFCAGDIIAIGASYALRQSGFHVPNDVAIMGYDDLFIASIAEVPLTTVAQPKYHLGSLAAKKLLSLINNEKVESEVLQPTLTIRNSCGSRNYRDKTAPTSASFTLDYKHKN